MSGHVSIDLAFTDDCGEQVCWIGLERDLPPDRFAARRDEFEATVDGLE